ncbi:hypothetical protein FQA39_LY07638 [Lamprigera yunnana]|nr:hypothetical protein FQA39_LY07638 [Lamprigera yunnana]
MKDECVEEENESENSNSEAVEPGEREEEDPRSDDETKREHIQAFVAFAALLAFANASVIAPITYGASVVAPIAHSVVSSEYDPNPQYSYEYSVNDAITGDFKSQVESRNGDFVKGQYSLLESDGTKRIVDYASDPVTGFNAVVNKVPVAAPIVPVAKAVVAAPAVPIAKAVVATSVVPAAKAVVAAPIVPALKTVVATAPVATAPLAHVASPFAYSGGYYPYASGLYHPYAANLGYRYPYGSIPYTGAW